MDAQKVPSNLQERGTACELHPLKAVAKHRCCSRENMTSSKKNCSPEERDDAMAGGAVAGSTQGDS